jgi:methionyl-tRNA formyltransferase
MLPRWRGAAPVERAILEGDAETGVCLMAVEAGLDTGGIYAELDTMIGEEETADELRSRLVTMGCQLLAEHLADGIRGLPVPRDQTGEPSYAEKIAPAELEVRWEQPGIQIRRVVRLGRAWTTFRGRRLNIVRAVGAPAALAGTGLPPGALDGLDIIAGHGTRLRLVTVQPEGKRPMDAADWLRGVHPRPGERLGT